MFKCVNPIEEDMFLFVVHNTGAPIAMMEFVCLVFLSLAFSVLKESTRVLFWQELSSDAGYGCILGAFFHLFLSYSLSYLPLGAFL